MIPDSWAYIYIAKGQIFYHSKSFLIHLAQIVVGRNGKKFTINLSINHSINQSINQSKYLDQATVAKDMYIRYIEAEKNNTDISNAKWHYSQKE